MKRIITCFLAIVMACALCACGEKTPEPYTVELADELLATELFEGSLMAPLPDFSISALYGIDDSVITEARAYMATNTSVSADELAILVLADEDSAMAAADALRARVALQITMCKGYCPAAVPRLEKAIISRRGNTLLYVVGDPTVAAELKLG